MSEATSELRSMPLSTFLGVPAAAAGYAVLELLSERGWRTAIVTHPCGVEVTARRDGLVVEYSGSSVASVALLVATECQRHSWAACVT